MSWDGRKWKSIQSCAKNCNELNITVSSNEDFFIFDINDALQLIIPSKKWFSTLKKGVPNQGFYKDVFLDAGVYLTTRNSLAAASFLGYTLESVSCTNIPVLQGVRRMRMDDYYIQMVRRDTDYCLFVEVIQGVMEEH